MMNNFIQSYKLILEELSKNCLHIESFKQIKQPKLSNLEISALNFTAEYFSINTECQLFRVLKGTELEFEIERSNYNKRRRKLFDYMEKIRKCLSEKFTNMSLKGEQLKQFTDVFIVDSTPIEICKYARAKRSGICSTPEIKPSFGYCAATKTRYFGYKLHAVCADNGVIHSFDFTPANVHDIQYLKDVKYNLKNCTVLGDRGYLSAEYQSSLFNYSNINLSVPTRKNQTDFQKYCPIKRKKRKRIETLFSQLSGQFTMSVNYAKTFEGLKTRILSKITALTIIQYLNCFMFGRELNKIKVNLF